jgi:hypothetical protein
MSCHTCGSTNDIQIHHDQYHPPITRLLCVKCHKELHKHGVGQAPGYTFKPIDPKMDIDRDRIQGDINVALHRVKFCLDQLERYGFKKDVEWETEIARHLTVEECIGALVAAEQNLEYKKGQMTLIE